MRKYLAGISGGPDSIALLYKYRRKIFAVCCVNYHIRVDSDNDVQIVKKLCDEYKIKFFVKDVYEKDFIESKENNFESWARKIRYDFFVQISHFLNLKTVLIAHNFNDWLETAYMSLMKKSRALYYGIQEINYYGNLRIKRPLLRFKKSTLQRFDDEHNLPYAIDYTNFSDDYERNRVRKIINNWNQNELLLFKKKIDKYNNENKRNKKIVSKSFAQWEKNNWNLDFIINFEKRFSGLTYYLIYELLRKKRIKNANFQKIFNICNFIFKKNNPNSFFRVGDQHILYKIKINKKWFVRVERIQENEVKK